MTIRNQVVLLKYILYISFEKFQIMGTKEIIDEIQKLPVDKRILVVEHTMRSIRKQKAVDQITLASEKLYEDYKTDSKLIEFTNIDFEKFYEAR